MAFVVKLVMQMVINTEKNTRLLYFYYNETIVNFLKDVDVCVKECSKLDDFVVNL